MNNNQYDVLINDWDGVDLDNVVDFVCKVRKSYVEENDLTAKVIKERFKSFLSNNPNKILMIKEKSDIVGLSILFENESQTIEVNPGNILGGHPLANEINCLTIKRLILDSIVSYAKKKTISKIEIIAPMIDKETYDKELYNPTGFKTEAQYAEMKLDLSVIVQKTVDYPDAIHLIPLKSIDINKLYDCYYDSFSSGDASFFFNQSEAERREYFDTLGLEEAINESASIGILSEDSGLIGFSIVLPYGEKNCHVSCMSIRTDSKRKGFGKNLLKSIINNAIESGYESITLGTDITMGAFRLYENYGFKTYDAFVSWVYRL